MPFLSSNSVVPITLVTKLKVKVLAAYDVEALPKANTAPVIAKIFLIFFFIFPYFHKYKFSCLVSGMLVIQLITFTIYNRKFLNSSTFCKKMYSILKSIMANI